MKSFEIILKLSATNLAKALVREWGPSVPDHFLRNFEDIELHDYKEIYPDPLTTKERQTLLLEHMCALLATMPLTYISATSHSWDHVTWEIECDSMPHAELINERWEAVTDLNTFLAAMDAYGPRKLQRITIPESCPVPVGRSFYKWLTGEAFKRGYTMGAMEFETVKSMEDRDTSTVVFSFHDRPTENTEHTHAWAANWVTSPGWR